MWSDLSSNESGLLTPASDVQVEEEYAELEKETTEVDVTKTDRHHASTTLLTQDPGLLKEAVSGRETGTQLIRNYCCGGGCCFLNTPLPTTSSTSGVAVELPDNETFKSLDLKLATIYTDTELIGITPLPRLTMSLESILKGHSSPRSTVQTHPPTFVQPHPPYKVYSAPLFHTRELTKPGAEKRTFHFDIDVTNYPEEGNVDFSVGGAIGICPRNCEEEVNDIFDILGIPSSVRDNPVLLKTDGGRWPTIWGNEQPRNLRTTRRELITWCTDIQSYPPTKALLRLLAEHAIASNERQILLYLSSAKGQSSFCNLRTGPHLSLSQLLHAFPSSKPPLPALLSVLPQLMPRFYSLSNDPYVSSSREGLAGRRLIEIAVTIHEKTNCRGRPRTGVGSGFLERLAHQFIEAEQTGKLEGTDFRIPMFRGLMANPLSKEFGASNGPMMLIGAGVGMAPFRGFILNRLRNANCASKIWLVQGVRDASLDELYSGELGRYEGQIKKVVQSRARTRRKLSNEMEASSESNLAVLSKEKSKDSTVGERSQEQWIAAKDESRYVQDEVRHQGDIVWSVIKSVDGRVFVCGSTKGMGEGVEEALREVAVRKTGMSEEGAKRFWDEMKEAGKYIAETW